MLNSHGFNWTKAREAAKGAETLIEFALMVLEEIHACEYEPSYSQDDDAAEILRTIAKAAVERKLAYVTESGEFTLERE